MDDIESKLYRYIVESPSKINFISLNKYFKKTHHVDKKKLKLIVENLIREGKLCYTSHFGSAFIEVSYDRPMIVSDNVIIKPPSCSYHEERSKKVISIERGASFGGGEHPSTRLAIQLIDTIFTKLEWRKEKQSLTALDIGTGSGVLAILVAKMDVGSVCAIDTDPCSVFEAKQNVSQNNVKHCVDIRAGSLDSIEGLFDIILANLRTPTLASLRDPLQKKLSQNAILIFSGLKTEEAGILCELYTDLRFFLYKMKSYNGWSALCLFRGDLLNVKP